jgi:hypothetical protein
MVEPLLLPSARGGYRTSESQREDEWRDSRRRKLWRFNTAPPGLVSLCLNSYSYTSTTPTRYVTAFGNNRAFIGMETAITSWTVPTTTWTCRISTNTINPFGDFWNNVRNNYEKYEKVIKIFNNHDGGDSSHIWNICQLKSHYTGQQPRTQPSSTNFCSLKWIKCWILKKYAFCWPIPVAERSLLVCWDRGFESRSGHWCLSLMFICFVVLCM